MCFTFLDKISLCVYSISGISGTIGNIALLAAIKYRSPPSWKSYTILLANFAIIDLAACTSSLLSMERFVPFKTVTASVYLGPCTLLSGFVCHILHSIMIHTLTQSLFFIAISFAYRLYVIYRLVVLLFLIHYSQAYALHRLPLPCPSRRKMIVFCIAVYLPTVSVLITTFYTTDSPDEVRSALKLFHPNHDQFDGYVIEGHVDLHIRWASVFVQIYTFTPIIPLCLIVFYIRHKILKALQANEFMMSKHTKAMHAILVKVLTLQASLPILFFCSVIYIILVKREIVDCPVIEYAIFWNLSYMPALAPLITIYNITPYREFVLCRKCTSLIKIAKLNNSMTNIGSK